MRVVFNRHTQTSFLNPGRASERLAPGAELFTTYPRMPYVHHSPVPGAQDIAFFNAVALRAEDSDNPRFVRIPYEVLARMLSAERFEVDVTGKGRYSIRDQLGRACRCNLEVLASAFAIRPVAAGEAAHHPDYFPTRVEVALNRAIYSGSGVAAPAVHDDPISRSFAAAARRHDHARAPAATSARDDEAAGS